MSRAGADPGPSEAAELIASIATALPAATQRDLRRLLSRRLAQPNGYEIRAARLGLLIELISSGTGEVPTVEAYTRAREEALRERGEQWPVASVLINAYLKWPRAVRAAMWLWDDGGARVAHSRAAPPRSYSNREILAAVCKCRAALVTPDDGPEWWPTEGNYEEWRKLSRELARVAGEAMPRHPERAAWRKRYANWKQLVAAAKRGPALRRGEKG